MSGVLQLKNFHLIIMFVGVFAGTLLLVSPGTRVYIESLNSLGYVGALFAGFFFSSMLTTLPATIALFMLGSSLNPLYVAIVAAVGAMFADFLIFKIFEHKMSHHYGLFDKIRLWFRERKFLKYIKNHRILKYSIPLTGALIIASPLPDELGIAILGASKYDDKKFFVVAFIMNFIGVLGIISLGAVL